MLLKNDYNKIIKFTFEINQYFNNLSEDAMSNSIDQSINFRLHVLNLLSEIFGFTDSAFFLTDENEFFANPIGKTNEPFQNLLQLYDQYYYKTDIFQLINIPKNLMSKNVLSISDVKPYTEHLFNEYYKIFINCGYSHILALPLMRSNRVIGAVGIYKCKKTEQFTDTEIEILNILNQHITQSFSTYLKMSQIIYKQHIIKKCSDKLSIGLIVLDNRYSISFFNDKAKEFCKDIVINNKVKSKANIDSANIHIQQVLSQLFSKNILDNIHQNSSERVNIAQYSFTINALVTPRNTRPVFVVNIFKNIDKKANLLEKSASYYNLTRRELEIVNLITKGYTNKEISNILYVSTHTVRTHVFNIFKKMDVNNRTAISNKIAEVM